MSPDHPTRLAPALGLLLAAAPALAAPPPPELDAEQVSIDTASTFALGGSVSQRLAQSFTLHRKGRLSHLMVPMSCQPKATVHVTIEKTTAGAPNGSVLAYQKVPGYVFTSLPTPAVGMRLVEFEAPAALAPGQYAFTLTAKPGDCGLYAGPNGSTHAGGKGWFIADGNGPDWIELFDGGGVRDLAFQVYLRPL